MSLQKQLVHLNMTGGLQTKDDAFIVIPSKLAVADNVEFDDASTVKTRGGQSLVNVEYAAGYDTPVRMFERNNSTNIEYQNGSVFRVTGTALSATDYGAWLGDFVTYEPARFMRVGATTRRILGTTQTAGNISGWDIALGTTTYCIARATTLALGNVGIALSVRRLDDDTELFSRFLSSVTSSENVYLPRVVYDSTNASYIVLGYFEDTAFLTASVKGIYFNEAGTTVSAVTLIFNMTYTASGISALMDASIVQGSGLCVVARDADATGRVRMRLVTLTLSNIVAATNAAPAVLSQSLTAHAVLIGGVLNGYALHGAGANLRGYRLPANTGVMSAESTITTLPSGLVGRIAVVDWGGSFFRIAFDNYSSGATYATTYLAQSTQALVLSGGRTAISTNCFLAGRFFSMRGSDFVPVVFESNSFQGTLFVLNITDAARNLGSSIATKASFVARIDYGEVAYTGMAASTGARLPNTYSSLIPYIKYETDLRIAGTDNLTPSCLSVCSLAPTEQLGAREINGLAFLAGAMPMLCDGVQIVEEGFHWGPEVAGGALTPAAAGIITFPNLTGTYTVVFTEGWTDAQGNWHESAPSPEYQVTITAGSGLYAINPTLIRPPSLKNNSALVMYRTLRSSTDTNLYLTLNGTTDANLPSGEVIYTTGGVLPNTPAPPCRHVSVFQDRLVLSGCGDGYRTYWSKRVIPGYGVEFSSDDPTHFEQVPVSAGRVVATEELDDRLVVLCEKAIGLITGTGPASTGTQGQYSDFSTVVNEVGCSWGSPKSVIRAPEGIWFRSPFGLRLFSRGGALARNQDGKQAGSDVDLLVLGDAIAVRGPIKQQLRFYQPANGTVLVWDYQWLQWSRFTDMGHTDAAYADDRFYHLSTNSGSTAPLLRYTDDGATTDVDGAGTAGNAITSIIETPWLQFAGIQGFQRIYRLMVLGRNLLTAGALNAYFSLLVYYDFSSVFGESANVTTNGTGRIQIQHHFAKQKCESMKLQVAFRQNGATPTRLRLTDLTLQVGVKAGYNKLPSSARF